MNGNRKGSAFEREICKQLSEWWSEHVEGSPRDDIFWRASQSGGRATQRAKSGKKTFGAYGDIAAVDPVGAALLQVFTLELKRGRSHGNVGDMLDIPRTGRKPCAFELTLEQARASHKLANSLSWLLISQRDRRRCMVFGDFWFFRDMFSIGRLPRLILPHGWELTYLPLEVFLRRIKPSQIIQLAAEFEEKA